MKEFKKLTDDELIRLINVSNEKAFNEIYDRYWSKLLAQATYDLKNSDEAAECVQDVFVKLWHNRVNISLNHRLSTYLYRAVKNQVINTLEKRYTLRNNVARIIKIADNFVPSADTSLIERELLAALESAIDTLPDKCASVYRLSRNEHKANREISVQLEISEKTVEAHITRALKHISNVVMGSSLTSVMFFFLHNQ
jgi:RNA polymerase sigma-70 factor (ECF subfamily)